MNVPIPASIDLAPLANIAPQLQSPASPLTGRTSPLLLSAAGVVVAAAGFAAFRFVPKPWLGMAMGMGLAGLGAWQLVKLFGGREVSVRQVRTPGAVS